MGRDMYGVTCDVIFKIELMEHLELAFVGRGSAG